MNDIDFYTLIPELKEWGDLNGHPYSPDAWLCGIGSFEHAVAYSQLFWPTLVEYGGCVFIGEPPNPDSFKTSLNSSKGEKWRVEALHNHVHIVDLFGRSTASMAQLEYLGEKLQSMWQAKARSEYPALNLVATFIRGSEEEPVQYQVTLFQEPRDAQPN